MFIWQMPFIKLYVRGCHNEINLNKKLCFSVENQDQEIGINMQDRPQARLWY